MGKWIRNIIEYSGDTKNEHIGAFAGQATFFLLLSLFPMASILLSLTEILPYTDVELIELLSNVLPKELEFYIADLISDIYGKSNSSVTVISIIVALWSSAKGIMAIRNGLNEVYRAREERNYLIIRGISTIYTLLFIGILVVLMVAQVFGKDIAEFLTVHFPHIGNVVAFIYQIRNIGTFGIVFLMLWLMYMFLPNKKLTFRYQFMGAAFVSITYLLLSRLFSLYVKYYFENSYMYGSISMIILLLLWFYFIVNLILIGGKINEFLFRYRYKARMEESNRHSKERKKNRSDEKYEEE